MKKSLLLSFIVLAFTTALDSTPSKITQTADLVLRHGRIYTMDAARSWAESVAILNGRIVYVGDDAGISPWIGKTTHTIELSGRFVLPGFIDAHVHPLEAGIGLNRCVLDPAETKEEALQLVKEYTNSHPDAKWIVGQGWPPPIFPNGNPQKEWLDAIVSDRPVYMNSADGHSAWVNSKALALAGITKGTPDPENGRIERNQEGEPSGTLREDATDLVYSLVPPPTLEEEIQGLQKALTIMTGFGITGFQDASVSILGDDADARGSLRAYAEADKRGIFTARAAGAIYADPKGSIQQVLNRVDTLKKQRDAYSGKYFRATAVKIYVDGAIEGGTAALLQPYLDKENDAGLLIWGPEKLNPFVEWLDREKFQIHIHAIGDRAVRIALTALEAARKVNGARDGRPLIAHLELIHPAEIPRFAQLNVIPVIQPLWAYADSYVKELYLPKLGQERMRWVHVIGSISKTGALLAMGSDWNVSSVNPLDGIEVAVTRQDPDAPETANNPFYPEERIDLQTALTAYTIGSAYANFWEKETGSIEVGKSADMIVLSHNLFEIPPSQINQTKVLFTLFEGNTVYRSPDWQN